MKPGVWILLGVLTVGFGCSSATARSYPRHWGSPPQIQTQDHVPLPGGYGMGSSTLAGWIRRNLERDARNPDAVPKLKQFPEHWGPPPRIQTRDFRPLPGGYGRGSSTLARWIQMNLDRDAKLAELEGAKRQLYASDFSNGKLGADLFVLDGEFSIQQTEAGNILELAATPLKNFGVLFGPNESTNIVVHARIRGDNAGRRHPAFAVGLGGVSGYQLHVAPAKHEVVLSRHGRTVAQASFIFPPGTWLHLKLQSRLAGDRWKLAGRVWPDGSPEPSDWLLTHESAEPPVSGRASIWGEPFAGKPIQFDRLRVERAAAPGKP